jgi:hypothetical protein
MSSTNVQTHPSLTKTTSGMSRTKFFLFLKIFLFLYYHLLLFLILVFVPSGLVRFSWFLLIFYMLLVSLMLIASVANKLTLSDVFRKPRSNLIEALSILIIFYSMFYLNYNFYLHLFSSMFLVLQSSINSIHLILIFYKLRKYYS